MPSSAKRDGWAIKSDRYATGSKLTLSNLIHASTSWEASLDPKGSNLPPWGAYVFGRRLKQRFDTEEDAKSAAVRVLRRELETALVRLVEVEGDDGE